MANKRLDPDHGRSGRRIRTQTSAWLVGLVVTGLFATPAVALFGGEGDVGTEWPLVCDVHVDNPKNDWETDYLTCKIKCRSGLAIAGFVTAHDDDAFFNADAKVTVSGCGLATVTCTEELAVACATNKFVEAASAEDEAFAQCKGSTVEWYESGFAMRCATVQVNGDVACEVIAEASRGLLHGRLGDSSGEVCYTLASPNSLFVDF